MAARWAAWLWRIGSFPPRVMADNLEAYRRAERRYVRFPRVFARACCSAWRSRYVVAMSRALITVLAVSVFAAPGCGTSDTKTSTAKSSSGATATRPPASKAPDQSTQEWADAWCAAKPGASPDELIASLGKPDEQFPTSLEWTYATAFLAKGKAYQLATFSQYVPDDVKVGCADVRGSDAP